MRKSYGAFKSVDDLKAISGLGPKRLEKMRKYLTIGRSPNSAKPAAKPAVHAAQTPNCKGCTKPAVNSKQAVVAVAPKTPATKPAESASSDSDDEEPELR